MSNVWWLFFLGMGGLLTRKLVVWYCGTLGLPEQPAMFVGQFAQTTWIICWVCSAIFFWIEKKFSGVVASVENKQLAEAKAACEKETERCQMLLVQLGLLKQAVEDHETTPACVKTPEAQGAFERLIQKTVEDGLVTQKGADKLRTYLGMVVSWT